MLPACCGRATPRPHGARPLSATGFHPPPPLAAVSIGSVAADELPILIVGDVHGDIERLFAALKPYPADRWRTIFLGDLVDYSMYAVGVQRFARDRPNTYVMHGNNRVACFLAPTDTTRTGLCI